MQLHSPEFPHGRVQSHRWSLRLSQKEIEVKALEVSWDPWEAGQPNLSPPSHHVVFHEEIWGVKKKIDDMMVK